MHNWYLHKTTTTTTAHAVGKCFSADWILGVNSEWVRERKKENKTTSRIKSQWNLHFHLTCKLSIVYGRLYFLLNAILPFFSLTVDIDMPLAQLETTSQCALNGSRALSHSLDFRWIILHAELIFNWIWLQTHNLNMYECTLKSYYHQQPTELWHRRRSGPPLNSPSPPPHHHSIIALEQAIIII